MRLRTLLGDHPGTAALKNGSIRSDLVEFDFVPYSPTNKGFKPMVREAAFDVSEMAIVTYLMAKSFEKPMVLLPDVVLARFQHGHALYNAKAAKLTPSDLNGKRVGIRSFTTTTGAWLRGILANDYWRRSRLDRLGDVRKTPMTAEFVDTTKRAPRKASKYPDADRRRTRSPCWAEEVGPSGFEAAVRRRRGRRKPGSRNSRWCRSNHNGAVVSRDVVPTSIRMCAGGASDARRICGRFVRSSAF
jgi:hypothetical protein